MFDKNTDVTKLKPAEIVAYAAWLQQENARLRAEKATAGKLSLRVSSKGAVSVYGMGRFPVTLYREQWERLLAHKGQIENFIHENARLLSSKEDSKANAASDASGGDEFLDDSEVFV